MNPLVNKDEFQRWWEHPGTLAFRAFLGDRVKAMQTQWAQGAQFSPEQQGQAVLMSQLLDLSSDDVAREYGVEVADGDAA